MILVDANLLIYAIDLGSPHHGELCSTDDDFKKFSRLRWHNPLKAGKS
jgi:hypothetical protein